MTTAANVPLCPSECCAARDRVNLSLQRLLDKSHEIIRDLSYNPKLQNNRATGRTTRLILRAMIAISEGQDVLIIAHSLQMAHDLKRKIIDRCRSWHIPVEPPRILEKVPGDARAGFRGVTLVDHYVVEQMEAAVSG